MRLAAASSLFVVSALAVVACTSTSPPPATPLTCASSVIALCKAACNCAAADGGQACAAGTYVDGAGGGALGWSDATSCELYFSYLCADDGAAGFNFGACDTALSSSVCVGTVNGRALLIPTACYTVAPEAGAG